MRVLRSMATAVAVLGAAAAAGLLRAGTAFANEGAAAPAAKPAEEKAAPTKPTPDKKPEASKLSGPTPAPGGKGIWASIDDFMKRTGRKVEETSLFGLRLRPALDETVSYTDNVFYQAKDEVFVVDRDPDGDGILAFPRLGEPRGKVADIVNTATLSLGLEMPLNAALIPLIDEGSSSFEIANFSATSVEYLKHGDSPDAFNYGGRVDLPVLLNNLIHRLTRLNLSRHAFYFQAQGEYQNVTDPLDVAKFQFNSSPPTFVRTGNRNDFERTEWYGKGILGWKGPQLDAKVSFQYSGFSVDDETLETVDHNSQEAYGEIGWTLKNTEHRFFGFYEYTNYDFDSRRSADSEVPSLRDYALIRTGGGWEGPLLTKKLRAHAEVFYLATDVFHEGSILDAPIKIDRETGNTVVGPGGNPIHVPFDEAAGIGTAVNLAYTPFATKATQIQLDYERTIDWSVVAQNKIVDQGSLSFIHPINDRLTAEMKYSVTFDNVAHREKRLFQEFGAGVKYKLFAYTDVALRYTLRHMRSRREPATIFADAANEEFTVRPDGDFTANIVSLTVTVGF